MYRWKKGKITKSFICKRKFKQRKISIFQKNKNRRCYEHKIQNMDETHLYYHHQSHHWVGFLINFLLDIITSMMIERLLTCAHFINFHLKITCLKITNGNVLCEIFCIMIDYNKIIMSNVIGKARHVGIIITLHY